MNDVNQIAQVHVDCWKSTYRGIIAEDYLAKLSVEQRMKNWIWSFENPNHDEVRFVAENADGGIVGFISGGATRSPEFSYDAELYAIYILHEYQRQGLGRNLVQVLVEHLRMKNYKSLMLWVLQQNPSVDFYKKIGGRSFTNKDITIGDQTLAELGIGWHAFNQEETYNEAICRAKDKL
jgi:GNAT superfamily N-acetyltransferase